MWLVAVFIPILQFTRSCSGSSALQILVEQDIYYGKLGGALEVVFTMKNPDISSHNLDIGVLCDLNRTSIASINSTGFVTYQKAYENRYSINLSSPKIYINIKNLQEDDFKCQLECVKYSKFDKEVGYTQIRKSAKAVIQTSTDFGNQTINIGQSNEYVCIAEGQPKPLVTWKIFDGEDANKTLVQSQGMASLKIQNAQMKDTNNYVCMAENIGGKSYKMMSLIVAYIEHEEEVEYQKVTVDIGGVLKSKCQISGDPDVQYKWYRPKTDADSTPALIVTVPDLFLANFKQSEYGNYTCVAKNAAGTKSFVVEAVPPFGSTTASPKGETRISASSMSFPSILVISLFYLLSMCSMP
ncbi:limbic system-associated membrane protein-like [Hydractinia symbiolongicarpus]|uniref:limbic system-associated membrane protein-like n=1 Tax=Hydractinia symbiolongicarpus TaxID=13093 RepID=UPI0025518381|nr:limbic system-associated membrane protein-like [Hydractinia symbiolongicarpus]